MGVAPRGVLALVRAPPGHLGEEAGLVVAEVGVRELPAVGAGLLEAVGVQLAHEAGQVAVLEVQRQQVPAELCWLPDDEAAPSQRQINSCSALSRARARHALVQPHLRPSSDQDTISAWLSSLQSSYLQVTAVRPSSQPAPHTRCLPGNSRLGKEGWHAPGLSLVDHLVGFSVRGGVV